MIAKWLLVLTCGAAPAFLSIADGAESCLVKVRSAEMTAVDLVGGDWQREFALDRPQTPITIRAQSQAVYRWVRSRADLEDAKAQWVVAEGIIGERGPDHCGIRDWTEVEAWLRRSAAQGYGPARLRLARLYWNRPPGVESPEAKGLELFSGAVAVDDLASQVYMGLAHECGRDVPKDLTEARARFASAAVHNPFLSNMRVRRSPALDRVATLAWSVAIKGLARASEGAMAAQDVCSRSW